MKINDLPGSAIGKTVVIEGVIDAIVNNPTGHTEVRLSTGGGTINLIADPSASKNTEIELDPAE